MWRHAPVACGTTPQPQQCTARAPPGDAPSHAIELHSILVRAHRCGDEPVQGRRTCLGPLATALADSGYERTEVRREVCRPQEKPFARAPAVQCRADRHWLVLEFVRKQHLNNNFTTPVCWGSVLEVDGGGPARNERCSRRKKKRGGSRARFKATVRHQVRTVRSPCSRRPATSDGVCNARATRSIAPLPGPGTRVRPRCPRRWEAGCCLLTGHALLFCSPVGDGRGRGRDSWDAPCSTS